jgi:hypothetical protein
MALEVMGEGHVPYGLAMFSFAVDVDANSLVAD